MSIPSVDQYVRSEVAYFSVIAEENEVPAAAQRRFGVRTIVDWTKNGASAAAREAEEAVRSAFFSFDLPATVEMQGLGRGPQERYFDCRKVEIRIYFVGDNSLLRNLIAAHPRNEV